jgi:hypothetical protein
VNGYLIIGVFDDASKRALVPMLEIRRPTTFQEFHFPPPGSWRFTTDTAYRYTYDFYRRTAPTQA